MIYFLHYIDKTNIIDGNVINILEYCLFCDQYHIPYSCDFLFNKHVSDVNVIHIFNMHIKKILESKYIYKDFSYNTIFINESAFNANVFYKKGCRLVLSDRTYKEIETAYNINILHLLYKDIKLIRTWYSLANKTSFERVEILNENENCGNINYIRKSFFSNIRNYDNSEDAFVLANGERELSRVEFTKLINMYTEYNKIYYCCNNYNHQMHLPHNYIQVNTVKENALFDFKSFIYVGSRNYDFAPRMLLESSYLNKTIEFFKYPLNKSARFIDIVNKDFEKYILTDKDYILI